MFLTQTHFKKCTDNSMLFLLGLKLIIFIHSFFNQQNLKNAIHDFLSVTFPNILKLLVLSDQQSKSQNIQFTITKDW